MGNIIKENLNLTGMVKFLNEKFGNKKTGKKFTTQDVQQYIELGSLPKYLGLYDIERVKGIHSVKLYNIIKRN
jgi:hypothetical protein